MPQQTAQSQGTEPGHRRPIFLVISEKLCTLGASFPPCATRSAGRRHFPERGSRTSGVHFARNTPRTLRDVSPGGRDRARGARSPIWRPASLRSPGASLPNLERCGPSLLTRFGSGLRRAAPRAHPGRPGSTPRGRRAGCSGGAAPAFVEVCGARARPVPMNRVCQCTHASHI